LILLADMRWHNRLVYSPFLAVVDTVRMDARAEQISNNNTLIPIPYAPPDQPHDDLTPETPHSIVFSLHLRQHKHSCRLQQ
jgi:hypothetical protein